MRSFTTVDLWPGAQYQIAIRRDVVENLIGYANRSGVTFYTIDTRGLSTEDPMMKSLSDLERVGAESAVSTISPAMSHHETEDVQLTTTGSDQGSMRELAEATGGFAVTNTNQIAEPMQHVMEDIRTHYELAYRPSSTVYDGHFRKIEVKISRPKVTLQTRKGYYAVPELNGEPLQPFELLALNANRSATASATENSLVIRSPPMPSVLILVCSARPTNIAVWWSASSWLHFKTSMQLFAATDADRFRAASDSLTVSTKLT